MTGTRDDSMDTLAESVIDEVLSVVVSQRQEAVDQSLTVVAAARRGPCAAERDLRAWRHRREFGHETGIKALQAAQLADFVPSAVPPGTHQQAVTAYLSAHPPVWKIPRNTGTRSAIGRAPSAVLRAARRALLATRRKLSR